jgi:hypothetical protein
MRDVDTLCGLRDPGEPLLVVAEDTLRDNFTKAQKALGMRHRSLYQAKHTYAVLALLDGESPAVVARSLGISLATLEKHYAAALQKGRTIPVETPRETPRRVAGGKNPENKSVPDGIWYLSRRDRHNGNPGGGVNALPLASSAAERKGG